VDLFTFIEREWCFTIYDPPHTWGKTKDNIALLTFDSYEKWIKTVTKITPNNPTNRARKRGVTLQISNPSDTLAKGMWRIYNETSIRQSRGYPFYGTSYDAVLSGLKPDATYITAHYNDEIIGFVRLEFGDNLAMINQSLSLEAHMDKGVTRALIAKAVEVSCQHNQSFLMYGRMGNHPSLDRFKRLNGFTKCDLRRFYIPLTTKGKLAMQLGLQRELKDVTPDFIKKPVYPVYNWVSRMKMQLRLK
jgi:hypothetical protein